MDPIKELGTFDTNIFKEEVESPDSWKRYPTGSPAEGLPLRRIEDTYPFKLILSEWYDVDVIKWGKIHKMPPGYGIKLHADPPHKEGQHVVHFVMSTNDKVIFNLDDEFIKCSIFI